MKSCKLRDHPRAHKQPLQWTEALWIGEFFAVCWFLLSMLPSSLFKTLIVYYITIMIYIYIYITLLSKHPCSLYDIISFNIPYDMFCCDISYPWLLLICKLKTYHKCFVHDMRCLLLCHLWWYPQYDLRADLHIQKETKKKNIYLSDPSSKLTQLWNSIGVSVRRGLTVRIFAAPIVWISVTTVINCSPKQVTYMIPFYFHDIPIKSHDANSHYPCITIKTHIKTPLNHHLSSSAS